MQTTSALYKSLLSDPNSKKEFRVIIADEEHGMDEIVTLSTVSDLFPEDTMGIGGASAKEIDLALRLPGALPRMARMAPSYRLVKGNQASEWIQKGIFYIDTRSTDEVTGVVTIHGYDDMLKAEQVWVPDQSLEFPMTMQTAVQVIAGLMGVTIDPRTSLNTSYTIDYPANDYTLRDVLRYIAVAHAGNWIITDKGQLRLVSFGQIPSDTADLGYRMSQLDTSPALEQITKVILAVDSENAYIAGDDTGRTLQVTCPYGTQEMANNLLSILSACIYTPAMAQDAMLDPAAEIGDGLTLGNVHTILAQSVLTFDGLMTSDAGAPGQAAQESEYNYQSPVTDIDWKFAQTYSLISKTSEQILLSVRNELEEKYAKIEIDLGNIRTSVKNAEESASEALQTASSFSTRIESAEGAASEALQTANSFSSKIQTVEGRISEVSQTANKISWLIKSGTSASDFTMTDRAVSIIAGSIDLTGYVTINGLSGGTTTVDGSCIKTGKISADRIDVSSLKVNEVYSKYTNKLMLSDTDNTVILGGDTAWNSYIKLVAASRVYISSSTATAGALVIETGNHVIHPSSSGEWDLGTSTIPFGTIRCNSLYVNGKQVTGEAPSISVSELKNSSKTISLDSSGYLKPGGSYYYLGSSSYYWTEAFITKLYLSSTCYITAGSSNSIKVGTTTISGGSSSVSSLTSGSYKVTLSSYTLSPGSTSYNLGSSSYYWSVVHARTVRLYYNSYTYADLTINSSRKLCVAGTAIH